MTYFAGPASYTGEDSAEITLHGNPLLLRKLALLIVGMKDVRLADGGEFTRRAFLHGKVDLAQAESVRRIIEARSEYELQVGRKLMTGELSRIVSRFRSDIINLKALVEAAVDFADEQPGAVELQDRCRSAELLITRIDEILKQSESSAKLAAGFQVALVGAPNAGKSSLMNRMIGWDRSIVSPVPGTTRDYVAEEIHIDGLLLRLVDTAGLRETEDSLEYEGVRRSKIQLERSSIALHVIDIGDEEQDLEIGKFRGTIIRILNKIDLAEADDRVLKCLESLEVRLPGERLVKISCKNGTGLDHLQDMLRKIIHEHDNPGEAILLEDRHRVHFLEIRGALQRAVKLWQEGAPDEVAVLELDQALLETGKITGKIDSEEVLGRIFSLFCVGK